MITTIAVIATLILCCAAFGKMQGEGDYREIERQKQFVVPKDLDHGPLWLVRAGVCSVFVGTAMLVMRIWGPPPTPTDWLDLLYFYGVAYGSFTPVHRLTLNKARGLDWRYIAPGNAYDRRFLNVFQKAYLIDVNKHWKNYLNWPHYRNRINRVGRIEYAFEWCVIALCAAMLIFTNT